MKAHSPEPADANCACTHWLHPEVLPHLLRKADGVEGDLDVDPGHVHRLGPLELEPSKTVPSSQAHTRGVSEPTIAHTAIQDKTLLAPLFPDTKCAHTLLAAAPVFDDPALMQYPQELGILLRLPLDDRVVVGSAQLLTLLLGLALFGRPNQTLEYLENLHARRAADILDARGPALETGQRHPLHLEGRNSSGGSAVALLRQELLQGSLSMQVGWRRTELAVRLLDPLQARQLCRAGQQIRAARVIGLPVQLVEGGDGPGNSILSMTSPKSPPADCVAQKLTPASCITNKL